jgi:hypothetical protein
MMRSLLILAAITATPKKPTPLFSRTSPIGLMLVREARNESVFGAVLVDGRT